MTTLQQHEYFFELVNDSVMTRTMDGMINFWNHSAEKLYGWRKEEAIGKVSHSLLQTQFPKPLEEIESELVRNGRWEGKLVHTTREGSRVVVESRWTLDLKGQSGAVFEINARSTDCEMDPEARTDETATERKHAQNLLEQTVTTLQQHEYFFELVNDSVMTRTMDGMINFWNHSAEDLYGWRKEEAIGRVSHNLLQTQFPKPLEEIESELVRNGRWEGKLVHTTREGSRVVVESRWTLDLKGQSGAVFEINARSTDCEMDPEARTDTYSVEVGRQNPAPASQLTRADDLLTKIANIVLGGGGIFCLLLLLEVFYYHAWTGQRQLASPVELVVYYVLPTVLAILSFTVLLSRSAYKIRVALVFLSTAASIYAVEVVATLVDIWISLPSVATKRDMNERARIAAQFGLKFDVRSTLEVVRDLRTEGVDAYPAISPLGLLLDSPVSSVENQPDLKLKSGVIIDGAETLPLSGISHKVSVLCNGNGEYTIYNSDEYGFHNPKDLWSTAPVDIAALGDSFTHGFCVSSDKNFVALIRKRYPTTLNLGILGNGPLLMLATLQEYLQAIRPRIVLWFYFEGNDLRDLRIERNSPLLMQYVTDGFSQGLLYRQAEIDRALVSYVKSTEGEKPDEMREFIEALTSKRELPKRIGEIGRLRHLRQGLGLVFEQPRKADPVSKYSDVLPLFAKVLARADESVRAWGGKLYFVYLPEWEPFGNPAAMDRRREVMLEAVKTLGIPVIDIHRAFQDQKDPLALFPFRIDGHYNEEGHRVVAEAVLKSIPAEN